VLVAVTRMLAPILPFLSEAMYQNLIAGDADAPDSVHLTGWPAAHLARLRDDRVVGAMDVARRSVDLVRTLRSQAGIRTRQPLATLWLALPEHSLDPAEEGPILGLIAAEANAKRVELIGDESAMVDRRVKPLLPLIGKRLGAAIPAVMAAAREGAVEIHADGSVTLAGVTLGADEVEIQATPRPGTAVAHDEGIVAIIDTTLTDDLRAEGDARELQRAIQDLRKDAGVDLDARIELWVDGLPAEVESHLASVARETLADRVTRGGPDGGAGEAVTVELSSGTARIWLRPLQDDGSAAA
jgi:isoleucyl-tRNA synthetase